MLWYRSLVDLCDGEIEVAIEAARQHILIHLPTADTHVPDVSNPSHSAAPPVQPMFSASADLASASSSSLLPHPSVSPPRLLAPPVRATYAHPYVVDSASSALSRPHVGARSEEARNPGTDPSGKERPSVHLRTACPACFGGTTPLERSSEGVPYVILAIDGNFAQKRTASRSREKKAPKPDPDTSADEGAAESSQPPHPDTPPPPLENMIHIDPRLPANRSRRLPRSDLEDAQKNAARLRSRKAASKEAAPVNMPDVVEDGMKVPNSALDGCENSFTAADEFREKASSRYFDCMGLAAMVCKHDIPLFWANIYTAGEGHFYAYALIEQAMLHLPPSWLVGILYDIGCTIHRSVVRWGILAEYLDRLVFAISVFHAYGHQWACQIHYHPRKQRIWGLTDGEGNERLWFLLSHLVSILRNTGYFVRLWTLDSQFSEIGLKFVYRLGAWEGSRIVRSEARLILAEAKLARTIKKLARVYTPAVGMTWEGWAREQWDHQRGYQSKPVPSASITASTKLCNTILALEDEILTSKDRVTELTAELAGLVITELSNDELVEREELLAELATEKASQRKNKASLKASRADLGMKDKSAWAKLKKRKERAVFELVVRIRARRVQARNLIRNRKMFQTNLMASVCTRPTHHRTRHTTDLALKTNRSKADRVIREHNKLVKAALLKDLPDGIVIPPEINPKVIWATDTPDSIWNDSDLLDPAEFDGLGGVPPWLADHRVQRLIRVEQEVTNCREELKRCDQEVRNMQEWGREQLEAIDFAISSRKEDGM